MPETMHGKWSEPLVPHKGWECIAVEDLEDDLMTCEMCETATIRYAHTMTHENYDGELQVGCICAENMAQDYDAREAERTLRNRAKNRTGRKARWLQREWKTSTKGNPWLKTRDGFHCVVFQKSNGFWGGFIKDLEYIQEVNSKKLYETEDECRMAAFYAIEKMKQRRPKLKRRPIDEYGW